MKLTKAQKSAVYNAVHMEFCKALNQSPQHVTDAMNKAPCFLGSEKHFEYTLLAVEKALEPKPVVEDGRLLDYLWSRGLTQKEIQMAVMVARGSSNAEVSRETMLHESGVKRRLSNVYKKLKVTSRAQLIVLCLSYMDLGNA